MKVCVGEHILTVQIKGGKAAEGLWVFLFGKMKKKYSKNVEK